MEGTRTTLAGSDAEGVLGCYIVAGERSGERFSERCFDRKTAKRKQKELGGRRAGVLVHEDHLWPASDPDLPNNRPCVRCGARDPEPLYEALRYEALG
ncbi:hypothetical protein ODZ83_09185 [Acaricomes phytoseiuli]|uniref:hypothetical protein n=1 Tax=Acaricomes phytoseiuli TaxID=291968 RepID=UPI002222F44D|nr:hypothetical protein [Acaricomes phytoseiuli]MCW1250348.1 hypothetical protein [Acaricomes phytoseiuli]